MPLDILPFADLNSQDKPIAYLDWPATDADTIYLEDFPYSNPPLNAGLVSIYLSIADTGAGTPTITPKLEFKYASGVYGPVHSIENHDGNTTFASPGEFEARLDTQSWWQIHQGWRLELTRSSNSAVYITYAYGCAI